MSKITECQNSMVLKVGYRSSLAESTQACTRVRDTYGDAMDRKKRYGSIRMSSRHITLHEERNLSHGKTHHGISQ